jgi:hypothetical protein
MKSEWKEIKNSEKSSFVILTIGRWYETFFGDNKLACLNQADIFAIVESLRFRHAEW